MSYTGEIQATLNAIASFPTQDQLPNFKSTLVANGQDAIERFRDNRPTLMLLDLMLPGISGFEVCRAVRTFDPMTLGHEDVVRQLGLGQDGSAP